MTRVLVVDDHPVVRHGLRLVLDTAGVEVVGEACDGAAAVARAKELHPDVVVMDLRLPGIDGAEATRQIRSSGGQTRVLMLSSFDNDDSVSQAIEAGASGYLLKDTASAELVAAVHAVARGETVLAPTVAATLVRLARQPTLRLTRRQQDVLDELAAGASNAEIADRLGIGLATVKTHLSECFAKLGVRDRTSAVTRAIGLGLTAAPEGDPQPRR